MQYNRFRTYDLAASASLKIPRHLKDQLDRAASSVVLNLAEGSAKASIADRRRFYRIALGSFRESQAIWALSRNQNSTLADQLGAHLYKLCKSLD